MIRGILKTKSVDINNFQRFIDPFFLVNIFFIFFNQQIKIDLKYFLIFFIYLIILNFYNIYRSFRSTKLTEAFPKIFSASCTITIFSIFVNNPNEFIISYELLKFFSLTMIFLFSHHILMRGFLRIIRKKGFNLREVVFLGNRDSYKFFLKQLKNHPWLGYRIIGWYSPNSDDYKNNISIEFKCDGGIKELIEFLELKKIDKLFFCHNENDKISFKKILKILGDLCLPISYIVNWDIGSFNLKKEYLGDTIALNIWNPENSLINLQIKRIFDLIVVFFSIILLFPIFIFISILIKISSQGPIFFKQKRYGHNGIVFTIYKFRTMKFSPQNNSEKLVQAKLDDKRITSIGRLLRKYSLDELPQLFNVLKGDMSLVGPRPHAAEHNEYYRKLITGYMQRHSSIPGMTGLAQINGFRGETKDIELMKKRIKYDLKYINDWSLANDLYILLKTIFVILKGDSY